MMYSLVFTFITILVFQAPRMEVGQGMQEPATVQQSEGIGRPDAFLELLSEETPTQEVTTESPLYEAIGEEEMYQVEPSTVITASPTPSAVPDSTRSELDRSEATASPTPKPSSQPTVVNTVVKIESISSSTGKFGDSITVHGQNFGSGQGRVNFYGSRTSTSSSAGAPVSSWQDDRISFSVPFLAGAKEYFFEVKRADGQVSERQPFTVTSGQPRIDEITPANAGPGSTLTFTGRELGSTLGTVSFFAGMTRVATASVVSWSETSVTVTIPDSLSAGAEYGVQLRTSDGRESSFKYYSLAK